ncbi:hypothetical protein [Saccharopolyspora kobensis]|uniref:hypothetical protein n=1 Tax=Saccharopolyspora kobensis TaxID=146035 RepID=UPI001F3D8384|nr:hypothetical protein [Saccharopolyspora kobensis]
MAEAQASAGDLDQPGAFGGFEVSGAEPLEQAEVAAVVHSRDQQRFPRRRGEFAQPGGEGGPQRRIERDRPGLQRAQIPVRGTGQGRQRQRVARGGPDEPVAGRTVDRPAEVGQQPGCVVGCQAGEPELGDA